MDVEYVLNEGDSKFHPCTCQLEKRKKLLLSFIPRTYQVKSFDNFKATKKTREAWYMIKRNPKESFFLSGPFGTGKTHLAIAQYKALIESGYTRTLFLKERDLLDDMQAQAYKEEYIPKLPLEWLKVQKSFHLFLDDLGKTKPTEDRSDQLFRMFEIIIDNGFNLTITTNLSDVELAKRYGENVGGGIVRRIHGICEGLEF